MSAPICQQCNAPMVRKRRARHSQIFALFLILVGLAVCCTGIGAVIGIPAILIGIYMGSIADKLWLCPHCRIIIPRA